MRRFKDSYTQRKQLRIRTRRGEETKRTARPGGGVVEGVAEAETFGVEWVRKWAILRDRLVEIAKVLHRYISMNG